VDIGERINRLDLSLFDHINGQTGAEDRRSLLALQAATRAAGPYTYLEIGSFLGGSLQPYVVDPLCERIVSIDPRPAITQDSRTSEGGAVEYEENTTAHMRDLLAAIPNANLDKLTTIEASTEQISPASVGGAPMLCFIDGEHTSRAALRDAIFCRQAAPDATIAFHDRYTVRSAIGAFLTVYGGYGYQLPHVIFAVGPRPSRPLASRVQRAWAWSVLNRAHLAGPAMTAVGQIRRTF